jgi:glycosyltransferase involved in cell wall biosynthesis
MTPAPLRILHVVPYYEQAWAYGGIPRLAATMTRALARRGHAVTVCTTDVRDAATRAPLRSSICDGVDVRMFRNVSNALAYHLQFFTPVGLRRHLRQAVSTFDIAHLHACHNLPGAIAAAELVRAGVPYVVSPNGTARAIERRVAAKRVFALTLGRQVLAKAARVVAVSQAEADQLAGLGIEAAAIARVPNPVDEAEFERPPDGARFRARFGLDGRPVLLFLGKLTPRKGVADLVRAFPSIDAPDAVLAIAGNDMGAAAEIDATVRSLRLEARVLRTGLLTGADRLDALAAANVVAYPSRDEIFGLVPLEALLCGTPVVVCNDSGCGEVIAATGGGLVVPPGHPEALADALRTILRDQRTWRHRAAAGGESARRLFGAGVICRQLESLYASVLADRRPTQRMRA